MAGTSNISASDSNGYEAIFDDLYSEDPSKESILDNLHAKDVEQNEIDTQVAKGSLMRQVAELASRVLAVFQHFAQMNRENIEQLKFSVKTNTKGAAGQLEAKGDLTSGVGFTAFTVVLVSTALTNQNYQAIAKVFADNLPRFAEVFSVKYDANSMTLQMQGRLSETELQNKASEKQAQAGAKSAVEQLVSSASQLQVSLARGS